MGYGGRRDLGGERSAYRCLFFLGLVNSLMLLVCNVGAIDRTLRGLANKRLHRVLNTVAAGHFAKLLANTSCDLPLRRVMSLRRSRCRLISPGGSFGVRGREGGCHGRLGSRGMLSIGGGRCGCRAKSRCVSVVDRYRGLNSCMMGIIRTHASVGRGGV